MLYLGKLIFINICLTNVVKYIVWIFIGMRINALDPSKC